MCCVVTAALHPQAAPPAGQPAGALGTGALPRPPAVLAKSAYVLDVASGAPVFQKFPTLRRPMASTAKLMTGRLVAESGRLEELATVSKAATEHKIIRDLMAADPQAKGFLELAPYAWRWPNLPSFGKLGPVLATAVGDILGQKIGVNDGLARAERDGQPFLDDDARTAAEANAASK